MDTNIKVQFYIFITSIYAGLLIGLAYDFYRVIRYYFKHKRIAASIGDLLFWVTVAIIFFYIVNKSNWGELRGYIFFGTLLGGIIYFKVLSKILYTLMMKLFKGIIVTIRGFIKILKMPFLKIKRILAPKMKGINRIKRLPKETIKDIRRYKKIISQKKWRNILTFIE